MTSDDNGNAERGELLDLVNGVPASPDANADGTEETVSQPAKVSERW